MPGGLDSFTIIQPRQSAPPDLKALLDPSTRRNRIEPLPTDAHHLVFDTETTGISLRSVVLQLALVVYDKDGRILQAYCELWQLLPKCTITKNSTRIHGITGQDCKTKGRCAKTALRALALCLKTASERNLPVIAHNVAFDQRLLQQTANLHGLGPSYVALLKGVPFHCLYQKSRPYSTLRTSAGRRKGFSNSELFEYLHGQTPQLELHDALHDVLVTGANYQAGVARRWW